MDRRPTIDKVFEQLEKSSAKHARLYEFRRPGAQPEAGPQASREVDRDIDKDRSSDPR